jgi:hypothetical protein
MRGSVAATAGGPVRRYVEMTGSVGVFFGLMGLQASVAVALVLGLGAMALAGVSWLVFVRMSRRRRQLAPGDDGRVIRAVLAGEDIAEPRLAPVVVDLATQARRNLGRRSVAGRRRLSSALLVGSGAVAFLLDGQAWTSAACAWALFVLLVASPRLNTRLQVNAEAAEAAARRHLADPPPPPSA